MVCGQHMDRYNFVVLLYEIIEKSLFVRLMFRSAVCECIQHIVSNVSW